MKRSITILALAALMISACTPANDFGVKPEQSKLVYEQEDPVTVPEDFVVAAVPTIDLSTVGSQVQVVNITEPELVEGELGHLILTLTAEEKSVDVAIDKNGNALVSDLQSAVETIYNKRPVERKFAGAVKGDVVVDQQCFCIKSSSQFTVGLIPEGPEISNNYYVVGGTKDWAGSCASKEQKFNHSSKDVYEDPIFTIIIDASQTGDTWFALGDDKGCDAVVKDNNWSLLFGTTKGNGNSGENGNFDRRCLLTDDGSFKVEQGFKKIQIILDVMASTYTVKGLNFNPYIYEIGNESGWSTSHPLAGPQFDGKYQGYYKLDGEFKFKPNADNWEGDWECGDVYDSQKPWSYTMQEGGNNFPAPYDGAGFYEVNVDLGTMEAYITHVTSLSVIGDFCGWGAGEVDMTYNDTGAYWEATVNLTSTGFKIRMNHDWTVSWGGRASGTDFEDLTRDSGKNLDLTPGTYNMKFYLSYEGNNKLVCTPAN